MGYIRVCDLCGKPMPYDETGTVYKVKQRGFNFFMESSWTLIEAHDECVKKLLNAVDKEEKQ